MSRVRRGGSEGERPFDERTLRERVERAVARRQLPSALAHIGVGTDVYRLVHDAADELPGVVIDRYGPVARIELYDEALTRDVPALTRALIGAEPKLEGVVALYRSRRGKGRLWVAHGHVPSAHVVREDGWRFLVRTAEEDAVGTGVFVDQREGRRLARALAGGRPGLNLFAHAGGFGVALAAGGASRVDHVDAARKCAPWAAVNLALNGFDPRAHRFLVDDAFKVLKRAGRRGPTYGVVVCDPPTTALDPKGKRFLARERLHELAEDACRALLEGGALLLSTNDRSVPVAEVAAAVERGAKAAGRALRQVSEVPLGLDLPPSPGAPSLRPMRGVCAILAG